MKKTGLRNDRNNRIVQIAALFFALLLLWLGLNYQQLYLAWKVKSETRRLLALAANAPEQFQNPAPAEDYFHGKLSPDFWEFNTINGGGVVSNGTSWHSAEIILDDSLIIQHFPDPAFKDESAAWHKPAAYQYNNASLIGERGFRPSLFKDVVLKFTAQASEDFYGTAGVIFQPVGTLQKDGWILKPFDMFGFAVIGKESSARGINGPICYFTLEQIPVELKPLRVHLGSLHTYEVRLHWVNRTEWLGSLSVDGMVQCQVSMPPFGLVEVHVWSDNLLIQTTPRRWWEIAPALNLKYQDRGAKQFSLGMIRIFEEKR